MRHGADELPRRIARQLRIRVQGDDVLHAGQHRGVADDERKAVAATACRRAAARSGPPACRACARSPSRSGRAGSSGAGDGTGRRCRSCAGSPSLPYFAFSASIRVSGQLQQRRRPRRAIPACASRKVGQQAEVQVVRRDWPGTGPPAPRPDLRRSAALVSMVGTTTSVRDCRRDAFGEVHARQRMRRHQQGCQPVHQRHRQLAGGQQRERCRSAPAPNRHTPAASACASRPPPMITREQRDGAQIQEQWEAARRSAAGPRRRRGEHRPPARVPAGPCRSGRSRRARARSCGPASVPRVARQLDRLAWPPRLRTGGCASRSLPIAWR